MMQPGMMPPPGMPPAGQGPVDPAMVQQIVANKPLLDAIMQHIVQQSQQGMPPEGGGAGPAMPSGM